jgi:hypothetical protein
LVNSINVHGYTTEAVVTCTVVSCRTTSMAEEEVDAPAAETGPEDLAAI